MKDMEVKLRQALLDLKASREVSDQLLREREDSEQEIQKVVNRNSQLKNELAELHGKYLDLAEQCLKLQQTVNSFSECNNTHEQALDRIHDLEKSLCESHKTIKSMEEEKQAQEFNSTVSFIKSNRWAGLPCVAVSLDIQSAFNRAWWPAILDRLRAIGCPANIFRLVNSYLKDRTVTLNYAGADASKGMQRGCVQGSACGPALWNLILDDLLGISLPPGCHIQAYADDVLLIAAADDATALSHGTTNALDRIAAWGHRLKLVFGPQKTQALAFSPRAARARIAMAGHPIPFSPSFRLLGVIIDKSLSFGPHVRHAVQIAHRLYNRLALFARPTWGIHPGTVDAIYKYVIVPIVTYGAGIWGDAARRKSHAGTLLSLQRGFAIKAIRGYRTVSTNAATALAYFTPLDLEVLRVAEVDRTRLRRVSALLPDDITLEAPVPVAELLHPARCISPEYDTALSPEDINRACRESTVQIYTDGSKQEDGSVGAAVVCVDIDARPSVTVRKYGAPLGHRPQAEAFAILQACRLAAERGYSDALVCSDSSSALSALAQRSSVAPLTVETHKVIESHQATGTIRFCWVKGHAGIPGNERADIEAGEAAALRRAPDYFCFSMSYVKRALRARAFEDWQTRYSEVPQGSHTRTLFPDLQTISQFRIHTSPSFHLTQFLTGHGANLSYLHRCHISPTDACPCDGTTSQDPLHLLIHCPRFAARRHKYVARCNFKSVDPCDFAAIANSGGLARSLVELVEYIYERLGEFNSSSPV
ncbi:uncharacterized protein LOC135083038 [Ostrinia nubilalis]|uniref:uncharacterized protein LOC135083038 n=1 Tax=Ostrinia nubilalis TaxID=29057 RepID=UPI0030824D4D